jgi:hypothetical protein
MRVVQEPLRQIARGRHILQPPLVLDADGVARETLRDAHRGDLHAPLRQELRFGQMLRRVGPGDECIPSRASQSRTPCASASETRRTSASKADCERRAL